MSREPARQEDPSLGLLRHVQALVRTCGRTMPEHDAEDLAQEALLALVAYEEQWGPIANARTWLVPVVRNLNVERLRRLRVRERNRPVGSDFDLDLDGSRTARGSDASDSGELETTLVDMSPALTPLEIKVALALAAGERRGWIVKSLGETPERIREVVKNLAEKLRGLNGSNDS